jgi:glycosyltransferase involved in cell wall biosynthesis
VKKVLLIGQTPPPYYGQSMMIKRLVDAELNGVVIYHLRMSFSDTARSVGKFQFRKILHLLDLIINSIRLRFKFNIETLYYFPAGPNLNPILRDFILLSSIRFFFKITIFHFRAAGLSEFLQKRNKLFQSVISFPYHRPDISIQLSAQNPADGKYLKSKKIIVVPNGIEDRFDPSLRINKNKKKITNILFVGALHKSKGIYNLVETARNVSKTNKDVIIDVIGEFYDHHVESETMDMVIKYNLRSFIKFHGVQLDKEKWNFFYNADVFCFPTFFESESFGNVLLEAMMFELPIISTKWRGIPDIVQDNINGILCNPDDSIDLTAKMLELLENPEKRLLMGKNGRELYLKKYSLEKHILKMNEVFLSV